MSSNDGRHVASVGGGKSGNDDIAISVRNLSKSYTIAHNDAKHTRLTEAIMARVRRPFARPATETFWALKDVNFDIARGEVVGVIGRNGAGKSTLLKVLSRITEPTSGEIHLKGRVGSLLEVGTGFHPELTGRENVFLNGAILGMTKGEINRQFDAIVEFAGVERFLDTPVKRYSSGMYVRLAFAVAAHLNPEILIVDEVLAVGDAAFQKKCIGKMQDVADTGKTVLLVSHNMAVVNSLCKTAIYLQNGQVRRVGPVDAVVSDYLSLLFSNQDVDIAQLRSGGGDLGREVRFCDIRLRASEEGCVRFNEPLDFEFDISADVDIPGLSIAGSIFSTDGACVGTLFNQDLFDVRRGEHKRLSLRLPQTNLAPGMYYAGFSLGVGGMGTSRRDYDIVIGKPAFEALALSFDKESASLAEWNSVWGPIVFQRSELAEVAL